MGRKAASEHPHIAQRGVLGNAKQADIVLRRAVDGQVVDGMAQSIKNTDEPCGVSANRHKARAAIPAGGGAGVNRAAQSIFATKVAAINSLQIRQAVDYRIAMAVDSEQTCARLCKIH
ncbi:hypothetical protein D3C86_1615200 [compost metagenome]